MRAEDRALSCLVLCAFALFQQSRVNGLALQLLVYCLRALAFKNYCRNPYRSIPYGKIADRCSARQGKHVIALLRNASVIAEHLPHPHPGVAVVYMDFHLHLGQRQHRWIGRLLIGWNQHAAVRMSRHVHYEQ